LFARARSNEAKRAASLELPRRRVPGSGDAVESRRAASLELPKRHEPEPGDAVGAKRAASLELPKRREPELGDVVRAKRAASKEVPKRQRRVPRIDDSSRSPPRTAVRTSAVESPRTRDTSVLLSFIRSSASRHSSPRAPSAAKPSLGGSYFARRSVAMEATDSSQAERDSQNSQGSQSSPVRDSPWLPKLSLKASAKPPARARSSSPKEQTPAASSGQFVEPVVERVAQLEIPPPARTSQPPESGRRERSTSSRPGQSSASSGSPETAAPPPSALPATVPGTEEAERPKKRLRRIVPDAEDLESARAPHSVRLAEPRQAQPPLRSVLRRTTSPKAKAKTSRRSRKRCQWSDNVGCVPIKSYRSEGANLWYEDLPVECDACGNKMVWGEEGILLNEGDEQGGPRFKKSKVICDSCACKEHYSHVGALFNIMMAAQARNDDHGDQVLKMCAGQIHYYQDQLLNICDRSAQDLIISKMGKQSEPEHQKISLLRRILEKATKRMQQCSANPEMKTLNFMAESSSGTSPSPAMQRKSGQTKKKPAARKKAAASEEAAASSEALPKKRPAASDEATDEASPKKKPAASGEAATGDEATPKKRPAAGDEATDEASPKKRPAGSDEASAADEASPKKKPAGSDEAPAKAKKRPAASDAGSPRTSQAKAKAKGKAKAKAKVKAKGKSMLKKPARP